MIYTYALRADTHDCVFLDAFFAQYSTGTYIYCLEQTLVPNEEPNRHIHAYFESTVANQTLRVPIRKHCGSGNGAYSLKQCEHMPVKYIGYIMKMGDYFYKGLTDETLAAALKYDEQVKAEIAAKKKDRQTILHKIIDYYNWDEKPPLDLFSITRGVVEYYRATETLVREFMMISQCQTLGLRYFPKEYSFILEVNIEMALNKSRQR